MARKRRRWVWIVAAAPAAALTLWILWPRTGSLEPWLKAMRARGEVFELEALRPPAGERDTNGNAQLETAMGNLGRYYTGYVTGTREITPGRIELLWRREDDVPEEGLTWASLDSALSNAQPALNALQGLLRKPPPTDLGWDYLDPLNQPYNALVTKRAAAQALMADLVLGLRGQQKERVLNDIEALCNLSRVHEREYALVNQMIRQAIAALAISGSWQALQLKGWNDEELKRLQEVWAKVRILPALPRTVEVERAGALQLYKTLKNPSTTAGASGFRPSRPAEVLKIRLWALWWADRDIATFLRTEQSILEAFRAYAAGGNWRDMQRFLDPAFTELNQIDGDWDEMRYLFTLRTVSNWRRASTHLIEFETKRALLETALALERYRLRTGHAPDRLEDLLPELPGDPPRDPMNGELFRYRLNEQGAWTLYSVGTNGVDDGGDPSPFPPNSSSSEGWGGKDLVWPRVSQEPPPPREKVR